MAQSLELTPDMLAALEKMSGDPSNPTAQALAALVVQHARVMALEKALRQCTVASYAQDPVQACAAVRRIIAEVLPNGLRAPPDAVVVRA